MSAKAFFEVLVRLLAVIALVIVLLTCVWSLIITYDANPPTLVSEIDGWFPYPPEGASSELLSAASAIAGFLMGFLFVDLSMGGGKILGVTKFGIFFVLVSASLLALSYVASYELEIAKDAIRCSGSLVGNDCLSRISDDGYQFLLDATAASWKVLATIVGATFAAAMK